VERTKKKRMPNKEDCGKIGHNLETLSKRENWANKNVLNMLMRPNSKKYQ
jgi:hypothetical protein